MNNGQAPLKKAMLSTLLLVNTLLLTGCVTPPTAPESAVQATGDAGCRDSFRQCDADQAARERHAAQQAHEQAVD